MELPDLSGKSVALIAMGKSAGEYLTARAHSVDFDEVWTINVMGQILPSHRVFMMDPPARFLDGQLAGGQTNAMQEMLTSDLGGIPIYSCTTDNRCPSVVEYPLKKVMAKTGHYYFNNTVAYALGFAAATGVKSLSLFGVDFAYKENIYFAEAGRACCEFWIGVLNTTGCGVMVASESSFMDTNVPPTERLYGYHRLDDPMHINVEDGQFSMTRASQYKAPPEPKDPILYKG